MREFICAALLNALALPAVSFANDQISYSYPLKDGSSLIIWSGPDGAYGQYELRYIRSDGSARVVWKCPNNRGVFTLSDVRSAYISDGWITALFETGGATQILALEVPETPKNGASRALVLTGLLNGSGFVAREELRLTDHNHFEVVNEGGIKRVVFFDLKKGVATVDGKPVEALPFFRGIVGQPPPPEPPTN